MCLAKRSSILRVLLRFCNLFAVFFVGSLSGEASRLAGSRLLRLFNFGISSTVSLSPTLVFFLDDDDEDDEDDDNNNESEDDIFIASTLFSFFKIDFVVGVGLNFAGSLLFELPISMMVDLGVLCSVRVVRLFLGIENFIWE